MFFDQKVLLQIEIASDGLRTSANRSMEGKQHRASSRRNEFNNLTPDYPVNVTLHTVI